MAEWIRNSWYVAGWVNELEEDKVLARTLLGEPLVIYRASNGNLIALEDRCSHRFAPLSRGRREGDCLRCMYHGLLFDEEGNCIEVPGQDKVAGNLDIRSFPAAQKDTLIWVWMGDPALAKEETILHIPQMEKEGWAHKEGYVHYNANYQLITDNLLDLSHLAFVHQDTIGSDGLADERASLERIPGGLRIVKQAFDQDAQHWKKFGGFTGNVDRWNVYDWQVKGNIMLMDAGASEPGNGGAFGDRKTAKSGIHLSVVTPETETTSHYFFSQLIDWRVDEQAFIDAVHQQVYEAFVEDKEMVEAQQKIVAVTENREMGAIHHDNALFQIRRMVASAISDERGGRTAL